MPTLLDFQGRAVVASTPNGANENNFFWRLRHQPELGFTQFHAPTRDNPFMPSEELERLRVEQHPTIYPHEFEAEFVDLSGFALFNVAHMMRDNEPLPDPTMSETVFAVIDSGMEGRLRA
jgi:hypothetical protein